MKTYLFKKTLSIMLIFAMIIGFAGFVSIPGGCGLAQAYAASTDASGMINSEDGAYMRQSASTSSKDVQILPDNTVVTIIHEEFTTDKSAKKKNKWYFVSANGQTGYVRSDLVDGIQYSALRGITTATVNYRKGPATTFKKIGTLDEGTEVKVCVPAMREGTNQVWYRVKVGKKAYYISGDFISITEDAAAPAETVSAEPAAETPAPEQAAPASEVTVSGITQPGSLYTGQAFSLKGTVTANGTIDTVIVGVTDVNGNWVTSRETSVGSASFDIAKADQYIKFGTLKSGQYKYRVDVVAGGATFSPVNSDFKVMASEVAAKLLANPTNGGSARVVYTFNTSNCKKLFSVKGYKSSKVPQGMAYTGDKYYIVYGMKNSQAIVTYASNGSRLGATKFAFNMGHPNGIAWDPATGKCYIFKGNQYSCYCWDPATNSFGKVNTPYSSSGIAYDSSTNQLYASSKTNIRVYNSDGGFAQQKTFSVCTHKGKNYVQDCGAGNGIVFHGVSGSNKHGTNYLDVYRISDSKYLGTIKINIDETESVIVDNDGFVQILVNTKNDTDYIYRTPLNVNDLN